MTDRYNAVTVVFEKDIRDDDAQAILNAMRMIKGVLSVTPNVHDINAHIAEQRTTRVVAEAVYDLAHEINSGRIFLGKGT